MSSFHATTTTAVHVLYDLCTHPELVKSLLDEIQAELKAQKVEWSLGLIDRLKRLDSFINESKRLNPPGLWKSV